MFVNCFLNVFFDTLPAKGLRECFGDENIHNHNWNHIVLWCLFALFRVKSYRVKLKLSHFLYLDFCGVLTFLSSCSSCWKETFSCPYHPTSEDLRSIWFNSFFEIFDQISHVGQYLLLEGSIIGAKLLREDIGKILCQHVQISPSHGLIVCLTCWSICICTVHGGGLCRILLGSHRFWGWFF